MTKIDRRVHHAWWYGRAISKRFGWRPKTDCGLSANNRLLSKVTRLVTCPKCKNKLHREALELAEFDRELENDRIVAEQLRTAQDAAIAIWWDELRELSPKQIVRQIQRSTQKRK